MTKYNTYEEKANRTFPVGYTVLLVILVALQAGLVYFGIVYEPKPQDVIHEYSVTVQPLDDGSLDITYELLWEALDDSEPLTWVEIGMANQNFTIYGGSVSGTILACEPLVDEDYAAVKVAFRQSYVGGQQVRFSFKVNQRNMLCKDDNGYFYEFVPGWFNEIQVKQYTFTWLMEDGNHLIRSGSLDYGEYDKLAVRYDGDVFDGCAVVWYHPFSDDGAYNGLRENKQGIMAVCFLAAGLIIIAEVYILDCYVSYGRGRGFLSGYGHRVHVYGRRNPHYHRARSRHRSSSSGGRSGGCACACACACAGGGRAGCSQKDTYQTKTKSNQQ